MDWSTVTKDPRSRKGWAKRGRGKSLAQRLFRSDLEQGQREWNSPITTSAPSPVPLLAPSSLHFTAPLMKELRPGSIMSTEEWKRHTHPLRSRPRNTQSHVNFFIFRSLSVIRPKRGYGAILKACTAVDSVTTCLATLKQVDGKKRRRRSPEEEEKSWAKPFLFEVRKGGDFQAHTWHCNTNGRGIFLHLHMIGVFLHVSWKKSPDKLFISSTPRRPSWEQTGTSKQVCERKNVLTISKPCAPTPPLYASFAEITT